MPRPGSSGDVRGHGLEDWERGPAQAPPCRWVPDRRVSTRHVSTRRRGGRAGWQSAQEPVNTRKPPGAPLAPNDGHGGQPLSGGVAMLLLLAFWVEQTPQRCGAWGRAGWAKVGRTRR